jgi:hypothetical protein
VNLHKSILSWASKSKALSECPWKEQMGQGLFSKLNMQLLLIELQIKQAQGYLLCLCCHKFGSNNDLIDQAFMGAAMFT